MAISGAQHNDGQRLILLAPLTIAAAVGATATTAKLLLTGMKYLAVQSVFLYGAGGTTVKVWVQTSLDGGLTWIDIINHPYLTTAGRFTSAVSADITAGAAPVAATDGTSADNATVNGVLGDRVRVKYITTGTYSGATSIAVYAVAKG
jgi:hypothetical protein